MTPEQQEWADMRESVPAELRVVVDRVIARSVTHYRDHRIALVVVVAGVAALSSQLLPYWVAAVVGLVVAVGVLFIAGNARSWGEVDERYRGLGFLAGARRYVDGDGAPGTAPWMLGRLVNAYRQIEGLPKGGPRG